MRRILKLGLAAALALMACAGAQAQSRFRHATPIRVSRSASGRTVRTPQFQAVTSPFGGNLFVLSDSTLLSLGALPISTFPVPGLGFDFAHLAAITRNLKVSDISVLSTPQRLALAQRLTPIVPFALPIFPESSPVIVVQQPPVVLVQQPVAPEEAVEPVARRRASEPGESVEPARPAAPLLPDVGEFVLVRRDGRLVFAVAFFTQGDQLTYVTREGVRRSMLLAELDAEATRRMNEERGTTIHLPA